MIETKRLTLKKRGEGMRYIWPEKEKTLGERQTIQGIRWMTKIK